METVGIIVTIGFRVSGSGFKVFGSVLRVSAPGLGL